MPERPAIRARRPVRLNRRQLVVIAFAIVALALLAAALLWPEDRGTYMPYADFARDLESGQIEQDADAVLALYKNEADSAPADERVLQVLKNKEGRLGKVYLDFDGSVQQFAEYMDGQREAIVQTKKMEKKNEAKKSNPKAAV